MYNIYETIQMTVILSLLAWLVWFLVRQYMR